MTENMLCVKGYVRFSFVFITQFNYFFIYLMGRSTRVLGRACHCYLCSLTSQEFILNLPKQSGVASAFDIGLQNRA